MLVTVIGIAPCLRRSCCANCSGVVRTLFGLSLGMFGYTQGKSEQSPNKVEIKPSPGPAQSRTCGNAGVTGRELHRDSLEVVWELSGDSRAAESLQSTSRALSDNIQSTSLQLPYNP
jgi:hypothetical protein